MATTPAPLLARDEIVSELHRSLGDTKHGLGTVPNAIKVVIRDGMWRERVIRVTGQQVAFSTFAEFVTTPPLEGLGSTIEQLRDICRRDPEALEAIDLATKGRQGQRNDLGNNVPEVGRPEGNTAAKALRRLRKDRPDLHAEVLAGEKSPHGAMVEAGFRPRTMTIPADSVTSIAAYLRKRLSNEDRQALAALLIEGQGS